MRTLLRTDLFKIFKNKITLVVLLISIGLSLFTVLIYAGINALINGGVSPSDADYFVVFDFLSVTQGAFSLSSNCGLIIPIFAGIYIITDINSGVLRNKVIIGKERNQIYASHFISTLIINVGFMILSYIVLASASLLFMFPYDGLDKTTLINYILNLVVGILGVVFISSFTVFMGLGVKSPALTIVMTALIGMFLTLLATLLVTGLSIVDGYDEFKYALYLIPTAAGNVIPGGEEVHWVEFAEGAASFLLFSAINCTVGCILFCKKDVK